MNKNATQKIVFLLLFISCKNIHQTDKNPDVIISKAQEMHGSRYFEKVDLTFDFREYNYQLKREYKKTLYLRSKKWGDSLLEDRFEDHKKFQRYINSNPVQVPDSMQLKYIESLNSVLYFIQIPYILDDPAVIKKYVGIDSIKGQPYHSVKVTFLKENGGVDFEDEYRYWIHTSEHLIDYLAYNYQTSGGGTRFREVIKRSKVGGIIFQDYNNYKPQKRFVSLDSLPLLFEQNALIKVSTIAQKNMKINP